MRLRAMLGIAAASFGALSARAQEAAEPELDFLEYLGSWQAEDEEWEIAAEWEKEPVPEPERKPEPEAKEETE
jgi:hypothetical protein